jgi:outer membrane lipoprotein SlyB
MRSNALTTGLAALTAVLLAACATAPRYDNGRDYRRSCDTCGTIENIDRVRLRDEQQSVGAGAVLGAIIGGVAGSNIGSGDDRKVATAAGAVAGGVIGHQIQKNNRKQQRGYQFDVRLDDGRTALVTQLERLDLRVGNRVMIRDHRVELLR